MRSTFGSLQQAASVVFLRQPFMQFTAEKSVIFYFMNMVTNFYAIQLHPWLRILGEREDIMMEGQKKTQLNNNKE